MGNVSSLLGSLLPNFPYMYRMPHMPSHCNVRTFYPDTTLGIYHFRDGKITLEQRRPAELEDDEDALQETVTTFMEPHTPRVDVALAFDFPEPLKELFIRLANLCRVPGTMTQLESLDAEIQSQVSGFSILSDRLVLEALVCLAIAVGNGPLVGALAARGAAPPQDETRFLWHWRRRMGGGPASDPTATTALLRHRWLEVTDTYANQISGISDEAAGIERIDALIELKYQFYPTVSKYPHCQYWSILRGCVPKAPVPVLRHLLSQVPIPHDASKFVDLVPVAGARADEGGPATIELLLGQGLPVDAQVGESDHPPRATALHAAVRAGSAANVRCLLGHGARMLLDAEHRTPLELAEQLRRREIIAVLTEWLREKGLGLDHVDVDPVDSKV